MTEKDKQDQDTKKEKKREINRKYREKKKQEQEKKEIENESIISSTNSSDTESIASTVKQTKRKHKQDDTNELSLDVLNKLIDQRIKRSDKYSTQPNPYQPPNQYPPNPYYPPPQPQQSSFLSGDVLKTIMISVAPLAMAYLKPSALPQPTTQSQQSVPTFGGLNSI